MIEHRKRVLSISGACTAAVCLALCGRLGAIDFVRGDFNADGSVSISDAYWVASYLFRGTARPDCILTGDADDNGKLDLVDAIALLNFLVLGGSAPPAPFPVPGADPTVNPDPWLDCTSYGGGAPLEDPSAKIEVLDAVAPGGTGGKAVITVRISHSAIAAGYSGRILVDTSVVGGAVGKPKDLSGTFDRGFADAKLDNGRIRFGFLTTFVGGGEPWMQPALDADALEITVCLKDGAPAGDYPLTLAAGELVDAATGRAIPAQLASGTLTVLAAVEEGSGCSTSQGCTDPPPPPPDPLPDLNARFSVSDAAGRPGGNVEMTFSIRADADVQGYSFSTDFDEEVLQAVEIVPVFEKQPRGFQKLELNNRNDHPGSAGVDEGFLVGGMVFSFDDHCHNMPANKDNPALRFKLHVEPETTVESTEVRFLDYGKGSGQPIRNAITAFGTTIVPELASSFVFVNGLVSVHPDIMTFVRGDSDGSGKLELSDAVRTLGWLFLGTEDPACFDAADANDDGTIDIGDPIGTLTFLYLGKGTMPPPYPAEGEDPTEDSIGCLFGP